MSAISSLFCPGIHDFNSAPFEIADIAGGESRSVCADNRGYLRIERGDWAGRGATGQSDLWEDFGSGEVERQNASFQFFLNLTPCAQKRGPALAARKKLNSIENLSLSDRGGE